MCQGPEAGGRDPAYICAPSSGDSLEPQPGLRGEASEATALTRGPPPVGVAGPHSLRPWSEQQAGGSRGSGARLRGTVREEAGAAGATLVVEGRRACGRLPADEGPGRGRVRRTAGPRAEPWAGCPLDRLGPLSEAQ